MGSRIAAKNEPNENMAKVMDTLEMLMARKKKIQCRAISRPTKTSFTICLAGSRNDFFDSKRYATKKMVASPMRYQTKEASLTEMSAPKMAVKPQINTMR